MVQLHGVRTLTWCLVLVSPVLAWSLLVATALSGMFEWLFPPPALSIPEDTPSLAWEMLVEDCPPAPPSTLEYELDPIQELFSNAAYEREVAWTEYQRHLTNTLRSVLQHGSQT